MNKEPRKGILGEWDQLTPKMKLLAVILVIVPISLYPPSVILFLSYIAILNIRANRKK